jgi:hypothetical protein
MKATKGQAEVKGPEAFKSTKTKGASDDIRNK